LHTRSHPAKQGFAAHGANSIHGVVLIYYLFKKLHPVFFAYTLAPCKAGLRCARRKLHPWSCVNILSIQKTTSCVFCIHARTLQSRASLRTAQTLHLTIQNFPSMEILNTRSHPAKQGFATHGATPSMELYYHGVVIFNVFSVICR